MAMKPTIHPATPDRWADVEAVFQARGCSVARGCWCMYYRESGRPELPPATTQQQARHERMQALVDAGAEPGLLACDGRQPVGWVSVAPRAEFPRLRRSPVARPVDDEPVWSVVCFVVPAAYRHRGVAHALLRGAVDHVRRRGGRIVEAYPIDKPGRSQDDWMWNGARSMFERAGFVEVARRLPHRPLMRLQLDSRPGRRAGP